MKLYRCWYCGALHFSLEVHKWRWLPRTWRMAWARRRFKRHTRYWGDDDATANTGSHRAYHRYEPAPSADDNS